MNSPKQNSTSRLVPCASALTSCLLGLLFLLTLACLLQLLLEMSVLFVALTLATYLLGAAVMLAWARGQPPLRCFGAANQVTLGRAALVALLFGLAGEANTVAHAWLAVGTAILAIALDGVDGWLARQRGLSSAFGARFDMETDALLILALSLLVWVFDKAGYWVLLAGLLRYLFTAAGYVLPWLRQPLPPSRRRQTVCVVQILILIICLLPLVSTPWSHLLAALGVLLLSWSFAVDVIWLARRARAQPEEANS
jgi:phosphatidylglycerophosphate synthase